MAKNYTIAELTQVIHEGKDLEQIQDIGRRYPLAAFHVAKCVALAGNEFVSLMVAMPEYLTANKVNGAFKSMIVESGTEDVEDDEEQEERSVPASKPEAAKAEVADDDYASMTGGSLHEILKEKGLVKECKEKMGDLKKQSMVDFLSSLGDAEETAEESQEADDSKYAGMSSLDLFKECKARKIKVVPKKPSKFYVELLEVDDAKTTEVVEEDDDDWGNEEEAAEPAPKKAVKPKAEEPEDEDDDWDI